MIDFYHLASEHEDPSIIQRASAHIRHLHMANPTGRVFPRKWEEFDYAPFFAALQKIGYDKRISVEASTPDFPDRRAAGNRAATARLSVGRDELLTYPIDGRVDGSDRAWRDDPERRGRCRARPVSYRCVAPGTSR